MANFRQKEKVVDPTAVPTGIDTQTIFSPTIPDEVKLGVRVMHHTNISVLQSITKHVLDYISLDVLPSQDYCFDYQSYEVDFSSNSVLDNVSNSVANSASNSANSTITITDLNLLIAFIHLLLRTLIRQKLKLSEVKEQLTLMNFPAEFVVIVCKVVMKFRMKLESVLITNRVHFPQLQKVRWRIDVVISSGLLSRIMRPTILLQMIMKDGAAKTFEISVEQFNTLRHSVAKVLHEMQTMERHPIVKIVKEFRKKEIEDYNK